MKRVVVSGGFDPLHGGHLSYLEIAASYGSLTVIVNNDAWLMAKKGYVFMPERDRCRIVRALRCVSHVLLSFHGVHGPIDDMSVTRELRALHPDIFCNGGDRGVVNSPEHEFCRLNDIRTIYDCGGGKVASSSDLVTAAVKAMEKLRG